jgi:hypothetical protein
MDKSKPGKALSPELKAVLDPIYRRDPIRYRHIARFVWLMQKRSWPDQAIAQAFTNAGERIHEASDWWAYMTSLMRKAYRQSFEAESDGYKRGDLSKVGAVLARMANCK